MLRALTGGAQVPTEELAPPDSDAVALRHKELESYIDAKIERAVREALARYAPPALLETAREPGIFARIGGRLDTLLRSWRK